MLPHNQPDMPCQRVGIAGGSNAQINASKIGMQQQPLPQLMPYQHKLFNMKETCAVAMQRASAYSSGILTL